MKACRLEDYANSHFNLAQGLFKSNQSIEDALSFNPAPLSRPLLRMNSSFYHAAVAFNKHLWEYTNPKGKGKDLEYGLQQIVALLLVSPPPIADEIYCQTLKQMTKCETQWVSCPLSNPDPSLTGHGTC